LSKKKTYRKIADQKNVAEKEGDDLENLAAEKVSVD